MPKKRNKRKKKVGQLNREHVFKEKARSARALIADPVKKAELQAQTKPGQTAYNLAMKEVTRDHYRRHPTEKQKRERLEQNKNVDAVDSIEKNEVPLHVETPEGEMIGTGKIIKTEKGLYWCFTTAAGTYLKKNKKVNLRIIIDR
jgi:hypothetical protein